MPTRPQEKLVKESPVHQLRDAVETWYEEMREPMRWMSIYWTEAALAKRKREGTDGEPIITADESPLGQVMGARCLVGECAQHILHAEPADWTRERREIRLRIARRIVYVAWLLSDPDAFELADLIPWDEGKLDWLWTQQRAIFDSPLESELMEKAKAAMEVLSREQQRGRGQPPTNDGKREGALRKSVALVWPVANATLAKEMGYKDPRSLTGAIKEACGRAGIAFPKGERGPARTWNEPFMRRIHPHLGDRSPARAYFNRLFNSESLDAE